MEAIIAPLSAVWQTIIAWFADNIWNIEIGIQIGYIFASLLIATLAYRTTRGRITKFIDSFNLPTMPRRIAGNLKRLITPLIALILTYITTSILLSTTEFTLNLASASIKLILAWIGISLCLQFIKNTIIRNIAAISIWIITALSIFKILEPTIELLNAAGFDLGEFRISALSVTKGILALFFLIYIASFLSSFLERRVLKTKSLSRSLQVLISKVIRIGLITTAILIGITSAGIDLSIFAIFSGAVGLGIGFGLQKVVSNLFSGLLLLTDQSIKPGDVIELENSGTFGWVNNMAARYTEIVTRDNKSYLIPNEEFITQRVVNWSHGNSLVRIEVGFGVHYNSNPHDVTKIAIKAASQPDRVVETPAPVCWLTEFGDSSVNFTLRFWIRDTENGLTNVRGQVLLALWDAFQENNISIPYPHREVYMHEAKKD